MALVIFVLSVAVCEIIVYSTQMVSIRFFYRKCHELQMLPNTSADGFVWPTRWREKMAESPQTVFVLFTNDDGYTNVRTETERQTDAAKRAQRNALHLAYNCKADLLRARSIRNPDPKTE